uniref:CID domain-containing protein n=1 Tax=Parastrongyloides trichosuri TaxID=131310 RepID=A0A0N4ZA84_PARTI
MPTNNFIKNQLEKLNIPKSRNFKKVLDKNLKTIKTNMKERITEALNIIDHTRCSTRKIILAASEGNLNKEEFPIFRKIIYDIVFYTTTPSQRKIYGAMKYILSFLSEELDIPELMKYVKIDNVQNALTHRYNNKMKNKFNDNAIVQSNQMLPMTIEQLNDKLVYENCLLEHVEVIIKYLNSDNPSIIDIYEKYKLVYIKMTNFIRPLFCEILKVYDCEKDFLNNFLKCFYKFDGSNDIEKYNNLSQLLKLNIINVKLCNARESPILREFYGKFVITIDRINIFENLSITDALYNMMILQILFKYPLNQQFKKYFDFLMLCSDVPEKFVYDKARTEYSRISKRLYQKFVNSD